MVGWFLELFLLRRQDPGCRLLFADSVWRSLRGPRACGKPAASRVIPSCRSGKAEMNYLLVFIGGGLGSMLRHLVNVLSPRLLGTAFPYHTFIINIRSEERRVGKEGRSRWS